MATMEELYQQYLLTQPGIGGSQNRYRDLMSQMRPFANPYPAGTGLLAGGTVAPVVPKVPARTNPMGTYGGGGGTGGGGMTNPAWDSMTDAEKASYYANNPTMAGITQFGQSVFGNTSLGRLQGLFAPGFVADQGLIAMGVDPQAYQAAKETFRQSEINAMNEAAAQAQAESARQAAQESFRSSEIAAMNEAAAAQSAASEAAVGSYGGGSFAEQQAINDAIAARGPTDAERQQALSFAMGNFTAQREAEAAQQAANDAAAFESARQAAVESFRRGEITEQNFNQNDPAQVEAARQIAQETFRQSEIAQQNQDASSGGGAFGGSGYEGGMFSGAESGDVGFSKGGKVTKNRLKGPDPKGPDEGYGALLGGEFVIQKSAVKKYGEGLLSMINDGKIPAKKLKSLLG